MEKEFVSGLYPKHKHENAPDFILSSGSIKLQDMITFCQNHLQKGEEWVNFDILQPKDATKDPYAIVNTYKSSQRPANQEEGVEEIPF